MASNDWRDVRKAAVKQLEKLVTETFGPDAKVRIVSPAPVGGRGPLYEKWHKMNHPECHPNATDLI